MIQKGVLPEIIEEMTKEQKLETLMEQYGDNVLHLAFSYVKQKQFAEDIAQDVFIKCYEKMDGFRNESSYKTWLYRITVNKCKDVIRSNRFKNSHVFEEVAEKFNTTERTPEMELIQNEEAYFISKSVLQLPVKYREILILYYFEDLKIYEISELLGLNKNSVKTRLKRGRQLLKKSLKEV